MTNRSGSCFIGVCALSLCLLAGGCGQKGPLYLPDDTRTASDRAATEPLPPQRNPDSVMPETGISTSEVPSRIQREDPADTQSDEEDSE